MGSLLRHEFRETIAVEHGQKMTKSVCVMSFLAPRGTLRKAVDNSVKSLFLYCVMSVWSPTLRATLRRKTLDAVFYSCTMYLQCVMSCVMSVFCVMYPVRTVPYRR